MNPVSNPPAEHAERVSQIKDFLASLPAKLGKATLKKLENTRISGVLINLRPERSSDKARKRDTGKPRRKHSG